MCHSSACNRYLISNGGIIKMRMNEQEILYAFQALIESLEDADASQDIVSLVEDALQMYLDQD